MESGYGTDLPPKNRSSLYKIGSAFPLFMLAIKSDSWRKGVPNRAPLPDNEIWKTQKWRDALALLRH